MCEQYTDKQIVEMLIPELWQAVPELNWREYLKRPDDFSIWNRLISVIYKSGYIRGQLGRSFIIEEKKSEETKAKESVNTFQIEDKVKLITKNGIDENNRFFPPIGTIGKVVKLSPGYCFIQWPKGSVCSIYNNGAVACPYSFLEKVTDEKVIEYWVPATKNNVCKGDNVRYINAGKSEQHPEFYPSYGTIGKVVSVVDDNTYLVQWPDYTTAWFANQSDIEVLLCE